MTPPVPSCESERLRDLRSLGVLDTPPEFRFDRLTRTLALTLNTRYSEINFIDENRRWSKSQYGLDHPETPRENSLCAHTILENDVLIVPDAREEKRFKDCPRVKNRPKIRFYMALPIRSENDYPVGTLCVFDEEPRSPATDEIDTLGEYRQKVERELLEGDFELRIDNVRTVEKDLRRELEHRVGNNLQLVLSFLNFERRINPDSTIADRHGVLQGRIRLLSLLPNNIEGVHAGLQVNARGLLEDVIDQQLREHRLRNPNTISVTTDLLNRNITMSFAVNLAIFCHELIGNVLNQLDSQSQNGQINVSFDTTDSAFVLRVEGTGIPNSGDENIADATGRKLIEKLCDRLRAEFSHTTDGGTSAEVTIPFEADHHRAKNPQSGS